MLNRIAQLAIIVVVAVVTLSNRGVAFGQRPPGRTMGQPIQAQPGPSRAATGPSVMGSARFLRENRTRRDFVGASRSDITGFVGNRQALGIGTVAPGTGPILPRVGPGLGRNNPLPPLPKKAMYYPRLVLDDIPASPYSEERAADAFERLVGRLTELSHGTATIIKDGRRAVLHGTVPTRADADRLAIIASFEPGIDEVDNQLVIETAPK